MMSLRSSLSQHFWSIWNNSPCKAVVDIISKVFRLFWTFSQIIMFIPLNFCITLGFTNVTWTPRTISLICNTRCITFFLFKENKDGMFLVFHVIATLKPLLVNLWNFFKKCFDLLPLCSQYGILMYMKGLVIPNKSGAIIKLLSPRYSTF